MSKQYNKPDMVDFDSDLIDLTDTEESSSDNQVYGKKKPYVLELYELTNIDPPLMNETPEVKVKKLKKKRAHRKKTHGSNSSDSESGNSSLVPTSPEESAKEEFYDAHGSYHVLPESQVSNPMSTAALALAHSEHGPALKEPGAESTSSPAQPTSVAQKNPSSTISKPLTKPE